MNLEFNTWEEEYFPIRNTAVSERNNPIEKYIYHTRGHEYLKVMSFPINNVWLLYAHREGAYMTTMVNKSDSLLVGYIITMNPWNNEETYVNIKEQI